MSASWQESYDKPRQHAEKQRHHSADKGPCSQGYHLPSGHLRLWEQNCKEGGAPKNWCLWTMVLEKTPQDQTNQSVLREISQSQEGLVLKLKLQYIGHLMQTADSLEKSLMLGRTEGRSRRRHQRMRWLDGITDAMDMNLSNFGRRREGQRGLACCSPWGRKESGTTGRLNNNVSFVVLM